MKKIITVSFLLTTITYVLPFIYQGNATQLLPGQEPDKLQTAIEQKLGGDSEETENTMLAIEKEKEQSIKVLVGDTVKELSMREYIAGVVAAEIPANFPEEALKAQAVAARTYTYYKKLALENGSTPAPEHKGAVVCDDYTHCKGYINLETQAVDKWGKNAPEYTEIIQKAVDDTACEIVTYQEVPIAAVFHSTAASQTENAEDVWGSSFPYLVSVESPGSEKAPKYQEDVTYTADEFREKMLAKYASMDLSGEPSTWFKASNRSEAGGIIDVLVGGLRVKGLAIRSVLGLNSTNFTITPTENDITFHTIGYGHGVGLSQYGAKELAEQGKTYQEILTWYYQNTNITKIL